MHLSLLEKELTVAPMLCATITVFCFCRILYEPVSSILKIETILLVTFNSMLQS
jgi:hypothetical protein